MTYSIQVGFGLAIVLRVSVRRSLEKIGFILERLEGPPGKREMLRAVKEV